MNVMKILFVSSIIPEAYLTYFKSYSKVGVGGASDVFQKAVLQGLVENDANFDIISYPTLGCFPHNYKKIFTPQGVFEVANGKKGKLRRYCTILGIKEKSLQWRAKRDIGKWLKANNAAEEPVAVLTYNFDTPAMWALMRLKKHYPKMVVATIVTDLVDDFFNPIYKIGRIKAIQLRAQEKIVRQSYKIVDKFILLSKPMEEKIPQAVGKSIVVEGISHKDDYTFIPKNECKIKTLLYTGSLGDQTSVKELVDGFLLTVNPDFRLVICGDGKYAPYIRQKTIEDNRIIFKGFVARDEAVRLQQEATAVINPRKPTIDLTRYSFPSKTIEYLSSGTPMIGFKLNGIPDEYFNYMYTVDGLADSDMAQTITAVLEKPQNELNKKAENAMLFVAENKNSKVQIARILDFIAK